MNHAQRLDSLLGKMLRIDVNVPDDDPRGYRVPDDNPFVDGEPVRALGRDLGVWSAQSVALQLRRLDPRRDVGAADRRRRAERARRDQFRTSRARRTQLRLAAARRARAVRCADARRPTCRSTEPIHDYGRDIGASITGGLIYRGRRSIRASTAAISYADFISGRVFSIGLAPGSPPAKPRRTTSGSTPAAWRAARLGMVSSFGPDHDGELLLLNYSAGTIVRVVPDFSRRPASAAC